MTTSAYSAIKLKERSLKKRVHASTTDPIRRECDLGEASLLDKQSIALITPPKPLKRGAGGEIIPPVDLGLSGLELSLKEPDLLDAEVSIKRTDLADKAGVFEMAIEAAVLAFMEAPCELDGVCST
jgi:hypothetical protein